MSSRTKKFFSYYKPYLGLFSATMICAFIVAAITLVFPLLVRYITKTILEGNLPDPFNLIIQVSILMLVLVAIQTAASFFVDYRGHSMGAMMERDMRAELFQHYQKLPFHFYDRQRTGQLMSRITNDLHLLTELYHHGPEDLMVYLVKFIGSFVILATINLELTLVAFLFLPFMLIFTYYFNKQLHAALKLAKERIGDVNAQVEDNLSGIRVVKSFTNEAAEIEKFAVANNLYLESRKSGYKNEAYLYEGIVTFTQLITVAVVIFGSLSILNASLDLADLIVFMLYIGNFIEPIQKFSHIVGQYQDGFTGFERFMEIIEIAPEPLDQPGSIELQQVRGDVKFENIGFRYHDNETDVLQNISLDIKAGEYIALVGSSGVGKTTLCALVPRFYEVTEGRILLDGLNIRDINLSSLRKNVGVVQQDVYLFAGTVLDNIRYGKPGAGLEEIVAAAKKANAHDFIMALPAGYDTDIGQRGVRLSGGQKQRLSIARVFLKDPPILIFDEATSSLDNESERVIQSSLEQLAKNRTTFVIAHRLSTIRNAGRIVVLADRGIEEQGAHAELIALNGTYTRLYNMQFDHSLTVAPL